MKKILFISNISSGSVGKFSKSSLLSAKENGYKFYIAANFGKNKELMDEEKKYNIKMYQIDFYRNVFNLKNIKAYFQLLNLMKREKFDIVHCNTPIGGLLGRICAKQMKVKKVIYMAHGFHFYKGAPFINNTVYKFVERMLAKWTDVLITMNKEDYEAAKKFKLKKGGKVEFNHGVGIETNITEIDSEEKEKIRTSLGISSDEFICITCGELNKNKNIELPIKAIQKLKNKKIHLIICGEGNKMDELKELTQALGIQKNVHFLGYRNDIPKLLQISDVFINTSYREGLPRAVMEAMSYGLPCIVSNIRGNVDLIESNKGGFLVDVNNVSQITEKINYLASNKVSRLEMGNINLKEIKKYDIENVKEELKRIYKEVFRIKVMHILSSTKFSGAENVAICIIKNIRDKNVDCIYVSPKGQIVERLQQENIKYVPIKKLSRKGIKNICKEMSPDIIHAHDFRASIIVAYSGFKGKIISHLHNNPTWIKKINLRTIFYLFSSLRYDRILMVSNAIKNEYVFSKYIKRKIEVIGNPIDNENIRLKVKEDKNYKKMYDVIFLGRLTEQKDPIRFIEIMKRISEKIECRVVMVGDGDLRDKCGTLIRNNELQKIIEMKGFIEEPFSLLYSSKILCMTSKWEGFGLVAIEALSLGVPVVATNVGGLPTIVNDKCGKVCCNDEIFIEEIEQLLKDEKYLKTKSQNAYIMAEKLNNINIYINGLINIYKE